MHSPDTPGTDKVFIVRIDGSRFGPFLTQVQPNKALIFETTLNAGAGDRLEHHVAEGQVETYSITASHFQPKMSEVEAHYTMRLRKD